MSDDDLSPVVNDVLERCADQLAEATRHLTMATDHRDAAQRLLLDIIRDLRDTAGVPGVDVDMRARILDLVDTAMALVKR